jgi:uncharacterized protein YecE (DUF72 family)
MPKAWIGISGWTFPGWRKTFYPEGLVQRKELEYASHRLSSIEINGTFYSLQKPSSFQGWYDATPENFKFAVKAPQFITHIRRLKEIEEPLSNFLASGILCLQEKMGPILWQFPPNVMLKDDRFEKFVRLLPTDTKRASQLAARHGSKMKGRSLVKTESVITLQHAFEFRHNSFLNKDFIAFLKEHNVAFVSAHAGGKAPFLEEPTANFIYVRLHGEGKGYSKGYPKKEISEWARKIKGWTRTREVFIYFSNEAKAYSPNGALALQEMLGITRPVLKAA